MPAARKRARHHHEGQTWQENVLAFRPRSALQTHLQGVDGTALTVEIEMVHHAAPPFFILNDELRPLG